MVTPEQVCGVNKFVERDIDMLLAEELRVNSAFGEWIMSHFGIANEVMYPAAFTNVSVVDDGSEADVLVKFRTAGGKFHLLLIENKIDAQLMPNQLERYIRRGEGEVRKGEVIGYSILFFTPPNYPYTSIPDGVRHVSFESAATALRELSCDVRAEYRASLLEKAIPMRTLMARDAHVVETDPFIKEWWDSVYVMLEREFPGFFLHKTRYPRSVYFAPETPGQATYLRVDFKGHKGEVDLAFKNIKVDDLGELLSQLKGVPGRLVRNDRSAAIQVAGLPAFVIADGKDIIDTKVLSSYQAAYNLLVFWKKNRDKFDVLASRSS